MKKSVKLIALVMAVALVLCACGGPASSTSASTPADSTPAASTPASTPENNQATTPTNAGDPVYGGDLSVLGFAFNTFFLPHSTTTSDRFNALPAIEALGRRNPETGETEGWLAESFTTDADALTCTIKLREGIKFHDDTDFNADAVIWNFDQMVEFGKESELGNPESFEKIDDTTIVVHYKDFANTWADVLGEVYIYSPKAYEDNGEDWAAIHAVGTGPFIFKELVQDSQITYEKNENYWREGEPYLDSVTVKFITDSTTQTAAFMNGELDVYRNPNSTAIPQLRDKYTNAALDAADLAGITYMMFCSGDEASPFYDVRVRQAVMHAVDWDDMADGIYDGLGASTPLMAVPGSWAYDESVEQYEYDLDKAKELLADAGYPDGFETVISFNNENAANEPCATILQAYLSQIGIKAEVNSMTNADFNAEKAEGTYQLGIMVNNGSSKMDFTANYIRLYSSEGVNYKNMMAKPEDYEEALFAARAARTLDEKKELLAKASKLMSHDYALVVAAGYQPAYCYVQDGVYNTGVCATTAEAWTPNCAWRTAG